MAGLAFTMSSEAGAGALLGWAVDHFAGTSPNGLLIGALVGIAVGMLSFIRGAVILNRKLAEQESKRKLPPPLPPEPERDLDTTFDDDWTDDDRHSPA